MCSQNAMPSALSGKVTHFEITLLDDARAMAASLCKRNHWSPSGEAAAAEVRRRRSKEDANQALQESRSPEQDPTTLQCVDLVHEVLNNHQTRLYYNMIEALHQWLREAMGEPNVSKMIEGHTAFYIEKMKLLRQVRY